ncbi:TcpE family conjugal transfer membrane protein, partial [Enterococcus faecium]
FSGLLILFGMNHLVVIVSLAIPYGLVQLFNHVEPDGKRAHIFLKDYFLYLLIFVFAHKSLYHEQLHSFRQVKVINH